MIKYTQMDEENNLIPLGATTPQDQAKKKPNIKEIAENISRRAIEILKKRKEKKEDSK